MAEWIDDEVENVQAGEGETLVEAEGLIDSQKSSRSLLKLSKRKRKTS